MKKVSVFVPTIMISVLLVACTMYIAYLIYYPAPTNHVHEKRAEQASPQEQIAEWFEEDGE